MEYLVWVIFFTIHFFKRWSLINLFAFALLHCEDSSPEPQVSRTCSKQIPFRPGVAIQALRFSAGKMG